MTMPHRARDWRAAPSPSPSEASGEGTNVPKGAPLVCPAWILDTETFGKDRYKKKGRTTGPAFSHGTLENKAHQQHNYSIIIRIPS